MEIISKTLFSDGTYVKTFVIMINLKVYEMLIGEMKIWKKKKFLILLKVIFSEKTVLRKFSKVKLVGIC